MTNQGYMASLRPFSKCGPWKSEEAKIRRFPDTCSICHQLIILTSRHMLLKMENLNNLVTNCLLFNKSLKIKDGFQLWMLIQAIIIVWFALSTTAFTKSMETQIRVLILTPIFPSFTIWSILLIRNIPFLLRTKYQTLLSHTLEVMAINMTEGWIPKSALSLFELKSKFSFVIWN